MKRFTERISDLNLKSFKYKLLVAFNYIQDPDCKFDSNQSMYDSYHVAQSMQIGHQNKISILDSYLVDLVCSNHSTSDLVLISDQEAFEQVSAFCIEKACPLQLTALISFDVSKLDQMDQNKLSQIDTKKNHLLVDRLKKHQQSVDHSFQSAIS